MAAINHFIGKQALVTRLLAAKEATGKTFTQISKEVGLTNVYTAQLFYNQVHPPGISLYKGRCILPLPAWQCKKILEEGLIS